MQKISSGFNIISKIFSLIISVIPMEFGYLSSLHGFGIDTYLIITQFHCMFTLLKVNTAELG